MSFCPKNQNYTLNWEWGKSKSSCFSGWTRLFTVCTVVHQPARTCMCAEAIFLIYFFASQPASPASVSFLKHLPHASNTFRSQNHWVFGPPDNSLTPNSLFTFLSHLPRRKGSTQMLTVYVYILNLPKWRELSGSGSVNWALIRCCSN